MSDVAIKVTNLSKRYRIGLKEEIHDSLGGAFTSWIKSPISNFKRVQKLSAFNHDNSDDIIWAVKDVSFEVKQGEVLGIIGKNGAGKSTLLKILARITDPTSGTAEINGRIASLLEVGTGFHPELTGGENVYLNGTILGMTKFEIDKKFDEIVDFSGVEKFIDTPVKRYSSGMRVRLAFAVAAHLDPEILLIDEVLAVGDTGFQKKCMGKMGDIAGQGRTVLFVTHNISTLSSLCPKTILLHNGEKQFDGNTNTAIQYYLSKNSIVDEESYGEKLFTGVSSTDGSFELKAIRTLDKENAIRDEFVSSEAIEVEIEFSLTKQLDDFVVGFDVKDENDILLFRSFHNDLQEVIYPQPIGAGLYKLRSKIPAKLLNGGLISIHPCATIYRKYWLVKDAAGVLINVLFDVPNPNHTYDNLGRPGRLSPLLEWYRPNLIKGEEGKK